MVVNMKYLKQFNESKDKLYHKLESGAGEFVNEFYDRCTKLSNADIDKISKLNFISYTPYLYI